MATSIAHLAPTPYSSRTPTPTPAPSLPSDPLTTVTPHTSTASLASTFTLTPILAPKSTPPPPPPPSPPSIPPTPGPSCDSQHTEADLADGSEAEVGEKTAVRKKSRLRPKPNVDPKPPKSSNPPRGRQLQRRPPPPFKITRPNEAVLLTLMTHRNELQSWPFPPPPVPPTPIDTHALTTRIDAIGGSLTELKTQLVRQKQEILKAYGQTTDVEALADPQLIQRTAETMEAVALVEEVGGLCKLWHRRMRLLEAEGRFKSEFETVAGDLKIAWGFVDGSPSDERYRLVGRRGMFRAPVMRTEKELRAGVEAVDARSVELRGHGKAAGAEHGSWEADVQVLKRGVERWVLEAGRCVEWHELRVDRRRVDGEVMKSETSDKEPFEYGQSIREGVTSHMPGSWVDADRSNDMSEPVSNTCHEKRSEATESRIEAVRKEKHARRAAIVQKYIGRHLVEPGRSGDRVTVCEIV